MKKNKFDFFIVLFGFFDIFSVLFYISKRVLYNEIPYYSEFVDSFSSVDVLGFWFYTKFLLVILLLLSLSFLLSGVLMMLKNRVGVFVSFLQFPFKLTLLVSPTLHFLMEAKYFVSICFLFFLIILFEISKFAVQVAWLRLNGRLD